MTRPDSAAHGWQTLSLLHARIEDRLERALQTTHRLSVSEYSVLEALTRQAPRHLRMQALATQVMLSQSATTRLVTRLERRGLLVRHLCKEDRRGIFTEVTDAGREALEAARPTHHAVLTDALADAAEDPRLAPLVETLGSASFAAGGHPQD